MIIIVLWTALIGLGVLCCFLMAMWAWFRFPERSADDVADFLLPIDLEKAETLLDPGFEYSMRLALGAKEFRRLQRKRVYLYIEFLRRMSHNAAVLVELGNREAERGDVRTSALAQTLQQEAVAVRAYSLVTLIKLHFWLLVRLDSWCTLPALSLCEIRETCGIRGLESYDRLKTAAIDLYSQSHQNSFEELAANL